jgi:hypothetical protein
MRRGRRAGEAPPALPVWKAFVVQFARDAGTRKGHFAGRVEHLHSGRRAHFQSEAELLELLHRLLEEFGRTKSRVGRDAQ